MYTNVNSIREQFADLFHNKDFVVDKSGVKTLELIGVSFKADEPSIFGKVNEDYVLRELEWYLLQSLKVDDIPGGAPEIWKQVADKNGKINSNYGYLIYSYDNYSQYANVFEELRKNPNSRRAVMIYTRPSMHYDYYKDGMSDFICTNAVNYFIRNGKIHAVVQMRSNDAIFGFKNDLYWQKYVLNALAHDLKVEAGDIVWNAASLHIYERHFYLVDGYVRTGIADISKSYYDELTT